MERIDRHNLIYHTFGEGLWGFGWNLAAPLTVLPLLIRSLGGNSIEVGLLAAVASAGSLLPQILGSFFLQSGVGKKRFLVSYHYIFVIPQWFLICGVIMLAAATKPVLARAALITLNGLSIVAIGFAIPVWTDWVASLFAKRIRGLALGMASSASAGLGAIGALLASWASSHLRFPVNYAVLFLVAAVLFTGSMLAFSKVRQHDRPPHPRLPHRDVYRRFIHSMMDVNFRTYLVSLISTFAAIAWLLLAVKNPKTVSPADEPTT